MSEEVRFARRRLILQTALAVVAGWLCCITPLLLVLLGVASISTAASLDHVLNGEYDWVFRGAALVFLGIAVWVYFRRRGVCTLDQARRQRNRILNTAFLALLFAVGGYLALWYLLAYWGAAVRLPWRPERWELMSSGALLGTAVLLLLGLLLRLARGQSGPRVLDSCSDPVRECKAPEARSGS